VKPPTPNASCDSFTADKNWLPYGGGNVTLTWATTNATNAWMNQSIGAVPVDGSKTVFVGQTKTFTLTAKGANNSTDTCTVTITVKPPTPNASCDSFTADKNWLPYGGGNVTLTWATTNADAVSINNGVGTVAKNGSKKVNLTQTTTFTLTVWKYKKSADTCQVTVKVKPSTPIPTCDAFTADPSKLPVGGGDTTLTWDTSNATNVSINQGIGSVSADGSKEVHVTETTTFTLTATKGDKTDICKVKVVVPAPKSPSCDSFSADQSLVNRNETVKLTWETTNADEVSIDQGIGSVPVDGSESVQISDTITFTLTATADGESVTCKTAVQVRSSGGGGGSSSPRCELEISDKTIKRGDEITISWDNTRTNDITLKDSHGNIIIDTDKGDKYDADKDSIKLKPTKDTKYTLNAIRSSKKDTCSVSVTVDDDIAVYQKREQLPLIAGISLSRIPYTGFDAGPTLTALFYILLTLWALGIAYVLVIRRGSVFGFALANRTQSTYHSHELTKPEPVLSTVPAQVTYTVPQNLPTAPVAIGYASFIDGNVEAHVEESEEVFEELMTPTTDDVASMLEERAHNAYTILSSDALNTVTAHSTDRTEQIAFLDTIIAKAKASFPSEEGWVVINKDRLNTLIAS
jgi:phage-related protein